ncbi:MAG: hypothetical protein KGH72_03410 [Candidatus Micrarchaeota archaeon]|nr:hypothetical protein [Candidatus Micrarchaeota archaeon]
MAASTLTRRVRERFTDRETGESLRTDIAEALKSIRRDYSLKHAKAEFYKEVRYRANVLDAVSLAMDACAEQTHEDRARLFRMALLLMKQADEELLNGNGKLETKTTEHRFIMEVSRIIERDFEKEGRKVMGQVFKDSRRPLTTEEEAQIRAFVQGKESSDTRDYVNDKIREKRVKSLRHTMFSALTGVASVASFAVSFFDAGIAEPLRSVSAVMALPAAHQGYIARMEYAKLKAAVVFMEERFGIRKPELKAPEKQAA